jgi:hypothetical protein
MRCFVADISLSHVVHERERSFGPLKGGVRLMEIISLAIVGTIGLLVTEMICYPQAAAVR